MSFPFLDFIFVVALQMAFFLLFFFGGTASVETETARAINDIDQLDDACVFILFKVLYHFLISTYSPALAWDAL